MHIQIVVLSLLFAGAFGDECKFVDGGDFSLSSSGM